MRKKILAITAVMAISTASLSASEDNLRQGDIRDIEKFFYNQGVKESYNEAYKVGYQTAMKDALMALNRYKTLIQAREAGKYISSENKVTMPEVYSVKTHNGLQIRIRGCRIEKELTAEDILRAPLVKASALGNGSFDPYEKSNMKKKSTVTNSVSAVEDDIAKSEIPMLPGNETKRSKRVYDNTATMRQILDKNNILYSVSDKNIIAVFSSNTSAEDFEKEYKLN